MKDFQYQYTDFDLQMLEAKYICFSYVWYQNTNIRQLEKTVQKYMHLLLNNKYSEAEWSNGTEEIKIWIDQISNMKITKYDMPKIIKNMDKIYMKAQRTLVILPEIQDLIVGNIDLKDLIILVLSIMYKSMWLIRAWTYQELKNSVCY